MEDANHLDAVLGKVTVRRADKVKNWKSFLGSKDKYFYFRKFRVEQERLSNICSAPNCVRRCVFFLVFVFDLLGALIHICLCRSVFACRSSLFSLDLHIAAAVHDSWRIRSSVVSFMGKCRTVCQGRICVECVLWRTSWENSNPGTNAEEKVCRGIRTPLWSKILCREGEGGVPAGGGVLYERLRKWGMRRCLRMPSGAVMTATCLWMRSLQMRDSHPCQIRSWRTRRKRITQHHPHSKDHRKPSPQTRGDRDPPPTSSMARGTPKVFLAPQQFQ